MVAVRKMCGRVNAPRLVRAGILVVSMLAALAWACPAIAATCQVTAVGASSITCGGDMIDIGTATTADQAALAKILPGTVLKTPDPGIVAGDLKIAIADVDPMRVWLVLLAGLVGALLFGILVTGGPISALFVGQDGRVSNSKLQAAAWMGALFIAYIGTLGLRLWSGMPWSTAADVGISTNLLALASVSAVAAGGAKVTTGTKAANAVAAGVGPSKTPALHASLKDLFYNDLGQRDIGDTQMILIAAASISLFIYNVVTMWGQLPLVAHVDLPEPTNTLTFAFGGSMGAYLAKKIGGTVGAS